MWRSSYHLAVCGAVSGRGGSSKQWNENRYPQIVIRWMAYTGVKWAPLWWSGSAPFGCRWFHCTYTIDHILMPSINIICKYVAYEKDLSLTIRRSSTPYSDFVCYMPKAYLLGGMLKDRNIVSCLTPRKRSSAMVHFNRNKLYLWGLNATVHCSNHTTFSS